MARIPEEELERLKHQVSIQHLVEAKGVVLKRHGSDLTGLCPFHHDKEPSLVISPQKNLWHCLGACQTGGSVIDFVMKAEGVSFRHAVELLRRGIPGPKEPSAPIQPQPKPAKHSTVRKMPSPLSMESEDQEVLSQVVEYYHQTLKDSPEALSYLEQRGLTSQEMIEHFKLGFADRTLGYRLPAKNRKDGAEARTRLQKLGILRSSGHEHFNGCLVIPVMDEQARVKEIYGRKITQNLRKGTPLHLYLPGPHRGIWNVQAVQAQKEVILCESLIDALTFWCAGFANVTASYGIEGFTKEMLQAFKEHKTERVLIAYDRDEPGDKAAKELADKLMAQGIDSYRLQFPKGMDANEYATKVQPASRSLGILIRSAVWLGKGKRPEPKRVSNPPPNPNQPKAATKGNKGDVVKFFNLLLFTDKALSARANSVQTTGLTRDSRGSLRALNAGNVLGKEGQVKRNVVPLFTLFE